MRDGIAKVKNLERLERQYNRLLSVASGVPRMILIQGFSGVGKTTGVAWFSIQAQAVHITCSPCWSPYTMLQELNKEMSLGLNVRSCQGLIDSIKDALDRQRRAIILDDVDFIFQTKHTRRLFEVMRYLHDTSRVPMVFIGMEEIEEKLGRWEQISRRFSEIINFEALDLADTKLLAEARCEIELDTGLLTEICAGSGGSTGRIVNALTQIEDYSKRNGLKTISLAQWKRSGLQLNFSRTGAINAQPRLFAL